MKVSPIFKKLDAGALISNYKHNTGRHVAAGADGEYKLLCLAVVAAFKRKAPAKQSDSLDIPPDTYCPGVGRYLLHGEGANQIPECSLHAFA
jgi:hypothetical protein